MYINIYMYIYIYILHMYIYIYTYIHTYVFQKSPDSNGESMCFSSLGGPFSISQLEGKIGSFSRHPAQLGMC